GRTARQMYAGRADWARIAELKRSVSLPVVGNGDIETAEDAIAMFRQTGCDAVMCGRATMKNPWIFRQIAERLAGREPREPGLPERRDLMLEHFETIEKTAFDPREALHKLRTVTGWYTHGLPNGRALRVRISQLETPAEFREAVREFFEALEPAPLAASA
ncbi:MAG: tRNA dihydrouridine synthase, partial [Thermoanaerobaculia bacterium]